MKDPKEITEITIKILSIIGFSATILLIAWLLSLFVRTFPTNFASLASIARNVDEYRPEHEIQLSSNKSLVNSGEIFDITWTDIQTGDEHQFTYTCTEGITLNIVSEEDAMTPMSCSEVLTLSHGIQKISLRIDNSGLRFTDVPLSISTTDVSGTKISSSLTVTVVSIIEQKKTEVIEDETHTEEVHEALLSSIPPLGITIESPVGFEAVPFTDLIVRTINTGSMYGNTFVPSTRYDHTKRNIVRIDIENIGTKLSPPWSFITRLPDGTTYTSPIQVPLKPQEHADFTIAFTMKKWVHERADIMTSIIVLDDVNLLNNSSLVNVTIF